ncbi:hypothetical protein [Streptomyces sp. NRRL S-378]|uniref:hypothetical protein n=1 Tax=Streptomyces sp. NRRL S-378 TaxID=1463904 RepID=UPI0004CAC80C|nr:hypothetical protein [Streptomyces sp. NRRL S-378]
MTLQEGQRVKLAADLRLAGTVCTAQDGPAGEDGPQGEDAVVGSLSLASGTAGTVERVDAPREREQPHDVREYVRLKALLDDFGHQMPPASRLQLAEQVASLEPAWTAHREHGPRVTVRVRLDNGFVLDDARADVFTPA